MRNPENITKIVLTDDLELLSDPPDRVLRTYPRNTEMDEGEILKRFRGGKEEVARLAAVKTNPQVVVIEYNGQVNEVDERAKAWAARQNNNAAKRETPPNAPEGAVELDLDDKKKAELNLTARSFHKLAKADIKRLVGEEYSALSEKLQNNAYAVVTDDKRVFLVNLKADAEKFDAAYGEWFARKTGSGGSDE